MLTKLLFVLLLSLALWTTVSLHTKPLQKKTEKRIVPAMDISYEYPKAYYMIKTLRSKLNMQTFSQNDQLQTAAQRHAEYLVKNKEESHYETEGLDGFTANTPSQRALKSGYLSRVTSENLSTKSTDTQDSIEGLLSAIYHRFGFLDPMMDEIGIGIVQDHVDHRNTAFVYMMGNSNLNRLCQHSSYQSSGKYWLLCKDKDHKILDRDYKRAIMQTKRYNPKIITYPYPSQKDVPPVFYQEVPDPLPGYDVSGFPISIAFNDYYFKDITLHSFDLYDIKNNPVETTLLDKESDPNQKLTALQFALMPLQRLSYKSRYKVEVVYSHKGRKNRLSWYFNTRDFDEPFFLIDNTVNKINIRPNSSNILYFEPRDKHDLIKDFHFPSSVYLEFIDHNTVRLTVGNKTPDEFKLKNENRELNIHIKN